MQKWFGGVCALLICAGAVCSASELSVRAGYTTYAMGDVNSYLRNTAGVSGTAETNVSNGMSLSADLLFPLDTPGLSAGFSAGYLFCNPGLASNSTTDVTERQYIIPLMAGGKYRFLSLRDRLSLAVKAFVGLGIGYATTEVRTASSDISTGYSGSAFIAELGFGGSCRVSGNIDIVLDIGYRMANLGVMNTGGSYGGSGGGGGYIYSMGFKASDALVDPVSGNNVGYDFSGTEIGLGINYRFN